MYKINFLTLITFIVLVKAYLQSQSNAIYSRFEAKKYNGLATSYDIKNLIKNFENIKMNKLKCLAECVNFKTNCTLTVFTKNKTCKLL